MAFGLSCGGKALEQLPQLAPPCDASAVTDESHDDEQEHATDEEDAAVVEKAVAKRTTIVEEPRSPFAPLAHIAFVLAAAVAVYSFVSVAKEGELRRRCSPTCILRPNYSGYEKKAPSFTLKDINGHDVSLESYRGKVVVLNFWTKTCGPCMEEMPDVADLARILKPQDDVAVVTVSTDESAADAQATLKSDLHAEVPFAVLMDPDAKVVRDEFGTSLFPETWIIDKTGVVRARFDGKREWSSATVVELVNQIRSGGYCPAQARQGKFVNEGAKVCDGVSG